MIPNQNLFRIANERTTFADAFKLADNVLHMGVRGVTDLMVMPGLINLDFADIRTVMSEMGKAMMGTGEADGERRAIEAAEAAISNPLLDEVSMRGARGVLINITGGPDMTLFEVDEAANRIREEVDPDANIIVGSTLDESINGEMRVSVVATGIEAHEDQGEPAPAAASASPAAPRAGALASVCGRRGQGAGVAVPRRQPGLSRRPGAAHRAAARPSRGQRSTSGAARRPGGRRSRTRIRQRRAAAKARRARLSAPAAARALPGVGQAARAGPRASSAAPSLFERVTASFGRQRSEPQAEQPERADERVPEPAWPARPRAARARRGGACYDIPAFLRR